MGRIAAIAALLLSLAACAGGDGLSQDEIAIRNAVAFLSSADGHPGIFVKGRDIAVTYAERPAGFAADIGRAALAANKAAGGKPVKIYVIDSPATATAIPVTGHFYCSVTANEGRTIGNNC